MRRVFADTHFYIAILSARDTAHHRAIRFLATAVAVEIVTTTSVLGEPGNAMTRPSERMRFTRFVGRLRNDPRTRVLDSGDHHYEQAGLIALLK
jgi:predicted nucleic acid-binding protein